MAKKRRIRMFILVFFWVGDVSWRVDEMAWLMGREGRES